MLWLVGLILSAITLGLLALPFWSVLRVVRLSREVEHLRARLATMEALMAGEPPPPSPATPPPVAAPDEAPAWTAVEPAPAKAAWAPSPVPPSPSAPPLVTAAASAGVSRPDDLEAQVGGRWLLYVGVAILLIGVSFFLKYAFDNRWITESGRVAIGLAGGLALVAWGWRTAHALPTFGLALAGTGIAVLYLSLYAALQFYALIGAGTAFGAMAAVTALAIVLADRAGAQSLALIAAVGGYGTPYLVGGESPGPTLLFSYDLVLGAGALALTRRHRWVALPVLAYGLTLATIAAWLDTYYTDPQWLTVLVLLSAFCALFVAMLRDLRRSEGAAAAAGAALLWTAPALYHVAAVFITVDHPPAIHVYLIGVTVVTILLTSTRPDGRIRLAALLAAYLPLYGFLDVPLGPSWLGPNLVTAVAIAGLHVITLLDRPLRLQRRLGTGDLLVMHASFIGLYGLLAAMLRAPYPEWQGGAAAVLAILSAAIWFGLGNRDPLAALNAAGLSFTLVAIALAVQFEGRIVVVGWAVEGAVAAWVGLRASNLVFRFGGLGLFALAGIRLIDGYLTGQPPAGATAFLNSGTAATAVVLALAYLLAWHWRTHPVLASTERVIAVALHVGASLLTMLWLSEEIAAYWGEGAGGRQAELSEELTRSLAWGLYGAALVAVGMWRALTSLRWIGMAAIGVTVLKVFFVDLSALGGIYRVIGFMVLGALLMAVSYLYQRTRAGARPAGRAHP